jgi:hypothetical protein
MENIDTMDWDKGCWENDTALKAQAELLIASDWAPIRAYSDIIRNNPESVYGCIGVCGLEKRIGIKRQ